MVETLDNVSSELEAYAAERQRTKDAKAWAEHKEHVLEKQSNSIVAKEIAEKIWADSGGTGTLEAKTYDKYTSALKKHIKREVDNALMEKAIEHNNKCLTVTERALAASKGLLVATEENIEAKKTHLSKLLTAVANAKEKLSPDPTKVALRNEVISTLAKLGVVDGSLVGKTVACPLCGNEDVAIRPKSASVVCSCRPSLSQSLLSCIIDPNTRTGCPKCGNIERYGLVMDQVDGKSYYRCGNCGKQETVVLKGKGAGPMQAERVLEMPSLSGTARWAK